MKNVQSLSKITFIFISLMMRFVFSDAQTISQCIGGWQDYTMGVCSNGDLYAWGNNDYGQLGTGSYTSSHVPVSVSGLSSVVAVVACTTSTAALKLDGTVWCWGSNSNGQLGNGTFTDSNVPVQVSGLTGIIELQAGNSYFTALKNDGTVWSWGANFYGQLGDSTGADSNIPVQAHLLTGITKIKGVKDGNFVLALKNDGTVWGWGYNADGELGDGTNLNAPAPVQVVFLTGIAAIEPAYNFSMALKNDGTVWTWGNNYSGQLGIGSLTNSNVPVQVTSLTGIIAIRPSLFNSYAFALKNDGTVWAWGSNYFGQLGNGTTIDSTTPVQVSGLTNVASIEVCMALKNDGTVWTWGQNSFGQLGNGNNTDSSLPVQIASLANITTISDNERSSFAVQADGSVKAWGDNYNGQLGKGDTIDSNVPVPVTLTCMLTTPGCIAHYSTSYDSVLNNFTLTVDSSVTAIAMAYHWDFGDGSTSTLPNPSHIYTVDSLYNVCMKIYTVTGDSCSFCHIIGKDNLGNIIRTSGFTVSVLNSNITTGVSEDIDAQGEIRIYPNPTDGNFTLTGVNKGTIAIYNSLGQIIYITETPQSTTEIDLSKSPKGIYILKAYDGSNTYLRKIIVQ